MIISREKLADMLVNGQVHKPDEGSQSKCS